MHRSSRTPSLLSAVRPPLLVLNVTLSYCAVHAQGRVQPGTGSAAASCSMGLTEAAWVLDPPTVAAGNTAGPGNAVVNVYINYEKKFAFVELRTVEEASNTMALDGIMFEGVSVRIRRPNDYNPAQAARLGPSHPNPNLNLAAIGLTPGGMDSEDRVRCELFFVSSCCVAVPSLLTTALSSAFWTPLTACLTRIGSTECMLATCASPDAATLHFCRSSSAACPTGSTRACAGSCWSRTVSCNRLSWCATARRASPRATGLPSTWTGPSPRPRSWASMASLWRDASSLPAGALSVA